jgi:hypothetical protein
MSNKAPSFAGSEADLAAEFLRRLEAEWSRNRDKCPWTAYAETSGWDILLMHDSGYQIGIEAKLTLNAKVIAQALNGQHPNEWDDIDGPDYRAVLVPQVGRQHHLTEICDAIGLSIITLLEQLPYHYHSISLPVPGSTFSERHWHNWCPVNRCEVPDYIPDVIAGHKSPVQLTPWKIKAIKLMICLERKGWVDRSDMRAIKISPSRWTDCYSGFLASNGNGQYVRCKATPDLRAQHPQNYAQIESDAAQWGKVFDPFGQVSPAWLVSKP